MAEQPKSGVEVIDDVKFGNDELTVCSQPGKFVLGVRIESDSLTEFAKAFSQAQGELSNPKKTSVNPFHKSKYADMAEGVDVARPILAKYGFSVIQTILPIALPDALVEFLYTRLLHTSGQFMASLLEIRPDNKTLQGLGSALTYLRRYTYFAIIGLTPEDDDGNAGSVRNVTHSSMPAIKAAAPGIGVKPDMTLEQLAAYVVPFGKKLKGKALGAIPVEDLESYMNWLRGENAKSNQAPSEASTEFLAIAEAWLNKSQHDQTQSIAKDDVPF